MFNASMRTSDGRISARYLLDLMQSDVLYFSRENILYTTPRHSLRGIQLNSDTIENYPEITADIAGFTKAVKDWVDFCEMRSGIRVDVQLPTDRAQELFLNQPMTALTLMNLLCCNLLRISEQGGLFVVAADEEIRRAIPSLGRILHQLILAAYAYDGTPREVNVIFAAADNADSTMIRLRRLIVAAAVPLTEPFNARYLQSVTPELEETPLEEINKVLTSFARHEIFLCQDNRYLINEDSREAALLFAEAEASERMKENRTSLRTTVTRQAAARYERVRRAVERCRGAIRQNEQTAAQATEELANVNTELHHLQAELSQRTAPQGRAVTIVWSVLCGLFAAIALALLVLPTVPASIFGVPSKILAVLFGILAVAALLLVFARMSRTTSMEEQRNAALARVSDLEGTLARAKQEAADAKRDIAGYHSYLVMTQVIAQDMQNGNFRGLDLAERLVPAELDSFLQRGTAAPRAQIIIALTHCGNCTENELAFLSGAGRDRVRSAIFEMISAGQIVRWDEDGQHKHCLSQNL